MNLLKPDRSFIKFTTLYNDCKKNKKTAEHKATF